MLARMRSRLSLPNLPANSGSAPSTPTSAKNSQSASASGSTSSATRATSLEESTVQEGLLYCLIRGEGINSFDQLGLLEQCDKCYKYFLSAHLRPHVRACKEDDMEDIAEQLRRYREREVSVEV